MRGDIYRLRSDRRARGHEQTGVRYGIVLQAGLGLSTAVVAPTSLSAQPRSFRPRIEMPDGRTTVLVDQLAAVDLERLGDLAGRVNPEEMAEIDRALRIVLGLL